MLPAAGNRISISGTLYYRGRGGHYWSSSEFSSYGAWYLIFSNLDPSSTHSDYRRRGRSVRCVAGG